MTQGTYGGRAVDQRMALAREWDDIVAKVRSKGFRDFLRPPPLETLLPVAEKGPVVIVNVSRWRCDALVVQPDGVSLLPLRKLTLGSVTERADTYLRVLQDGEEADRAYHATRNAVGARADLDARSRLFRLGLNAEDAQRRVDDMLADLQAWMWDVIAGPVLTELGLDRAPPGPSSTWPRLWWCPTGPLTVLPLHSAGHHDLANGASRAVIDRVVSSYTPTLRALREARSAQNGSTISDPHPPPAHSLTKSTADEDPDRLLLVEVEDLPGQAPLDGSRVHAVLTDRIPRKRRTVLAGLNARRMPVQAAMARHRWAHFSCHGDQDLHDPSRGGLLLSDGMLTIADVSSGRPFHSDFAGLSACKTAVGGIDLPDEAITLAAALHYSGYRHVVATMWSVDNDISAQVFAEIYTEIAIGGRIEPDRAPAALHDAVRRLRSAHPDWPHRWTPFSHTGP
jgi:hypothetical protein